MAELNFGILDTQLPGRIAAIPQQIEQSQMQNALQGLQMQHAAGQNELAKYQLSSAKRTDTEAEQLRGLFKKRTDYTSPEFLQAMYAISPKEGQSYAKALREEKTAELNQKKLTSQTGKLDLDTQLAKGESALNTLSRLASVPGGATDAAIDAALAGEIKNGILDPAKAEQMAAQFKSIPLAARPQQFQLFAMKANERLTALLPKPQVVGNSIVNMNPLAGQVGGAIPGAAPLNIPQSALAKVIADKAAAVASNAPSAVIAAYDDEINKEKNLEKGRQAAAMKWNPETLRFENVAPAGASMRPPVAATPPVNAMATPPVNALIPRPAAPAVATPAGNLKPSPREIRDARMKGFTFNPDGSMTRIPGGPADKAAVERTPVQETKFKKDLANDYVTVTATMQGMQDVLDSIADVRGSDISGATGLSSYIPTIPNGKTAQAETNLANLKGKITSLGQTIANQSGKVGPMAVQEWTIVRDMVSALDTAVKKGKNITLDEINKIEFTAKNIAERIKNKYENQYGDELSDYPQFATIPEPKSRIKGPNAPSPAPKANAPAATPAPGWGKAVAK